jgi:2-methylisocitrate lyase-like PEP mutase family enzyme
VATQLEKAEAFAALHAGEPFLIPNPWDAGSARVLGAVCDAVGKPVNVLATPRLSVA